MLRSVLGSMYKPISIATLFIYIFLGCSLLDNPEKIPSFILINSVDLEINNSDEGTDSHAISDAWIYVNSNLEGVYELPATIPLHYQGNQEISIYPGIKKNGISADREKYSFYTPHIQSIDLIPDSVITINPVVDYKDDIYIWIEDFEDPQPKFEKFSTSDTDIVIIDSPLSELFEGKAGAIRMNSNNYYCEIRTDVLEFDDLPTNLNIPAYMEMNYKCNYNFEVGILHKDNSIPSYIKQPLITLLPTTDIDGVSQWNKTYLYLPDATNFSTSATHFDIYISVLNDQSIDGIDILLDNIKVIF